MNCVNTNVSILFSIFFSVLRTQFALQIYFSMKNSTIKIQEKQLKIYLHGNWMNEWNNLLIATQEYDRSKGKDISL